MTPGDEAAPETCPCGRAAPASAQRRFAGAPVDGPRGTPWVDALVVCGACGVTYLNAPDAPLGGGSRFVGAIEKLVAFARRRRAAWCARLIPPGGQVLDVGAGRGLFLAELARRGFGVRGIEASADYAALALPEAHVAAGTLSSGWRSDEPLDLVTFWHSLEHHPAPLTSLRAVAGSMRPGAMLVVAVPNAGSLQARVAGPLWLHLDLPFHRFHFTPTTLRALLEDAGFRVERTWTGQWEMDVLGWLEAVAGRLGLPRRFLFDALRPGSGHGLGARAAGLALLAFGTPLAALAALVCRLTGSAGSLFVLARREALA
ncbi:MAG: class I SAM-dependent methyltransferase [Planctomycetota bacterium]